jgi:hypothetical protein
MRRPDPNWISVILNAAALALGGKTYLDKMNERNEAVRQAQLKAEAEKRAESYLEQSRDLLAKLNEQASTSVQSKPAIEDTKESSVFDFLNDFLGDCFNTFNDFLISLDIIQTLSFINLLVLLALAQIIFNIFIIYLSDYYISEFKLETRFPKLTRYLRLRKYLTQWSLKMYTGLFFLVFVYGFIVNTAIFWYV